jgi:hypothetical protein
MVRTVTGASTRWTLDSSTSISRARRQSALTSPSRRYSQRLSRSICSSKQELPDAVVRELAVMLVVQDDAKGGTDAGAEGRTVAAVDSAGVLFMRVCQSE